MSSRCTMPARGSVAAAGVVGQQAVEQRARPVAGRRVHHQAGRLVDHQQVLVLEARSSAPSARAGRPGSRRCGTQFDLDALPGLHLARRRVARPRRRRARGPARSAPAGGCARTRGASATSALSSRWPCSASPATAHRRSFGARRSASSAVGLASSRARRLDAGSGVDHIICAPVSQDALRLRCSEPDDRSCRCRACDRCGVPLALLAGCGSTPEGRDRRAGAPRNCMQRPRTRSPRGSYDKAIKLFERLEGRAAGTPLAQQAQLERAYAHVQAAARRRQALATLDRFIKLHPASPALDYALYLQGPGQLQRQPGPPRHPGARRTCPSATSRPSRESFQSFKQLVDALPATRRYARRRAAAHELHRQLAGRVRSARGALLLPPRRLRRGRQPRAAGACRTSSTSPAAEEALFIMVQQLRRAGPDRAARRRRARAGEELPEQPLPQRAA